MANPTQRASAELPRNGGAGERGNGEVSSAGRIVFSASNHGNAKEALETIQHEILGHFGLDLFRPSDKQRILDYVKDASKSNPALKADFAQELKDANRDGETGFAGLVY